MSSRSDSASEVPVPKLPPMPSGGMSLPDDEVLAVAVPLGAASPRPVVMVLAALPALALPERLSEERTVPPGVSPRVRPSTPDGSVYWMPPAPTTSGKPSPFMSK